MKKLLIGLTLLTSISSFADVGNGIALTCVKGDLRFEVLNTALPTRFAGRLSEKGVESQINFVCTNVSSAEKVMSCVEEREGDGRYMLDIEESGVSALTFAYLSVEQIYPLAPKALETLVCK